MTPVCLVALALLSCATSAPPVDPTGSAPDAAAPDTRGTEPRASAGCASQTARYAAGSQTGQLTIGGSARSFLLHVPPAHDGRRPLPLVVLLHGGLGTGAQLEASALMSPIADREGFVAVYPDGESRTWNAGRCCGPAVEQNVDDVAFIGALLDHLGGELCLDQRRVYATGMSNGAMLSHRLGCELAERIAAIAPVSGTNVTDSCTPKRPMPVMHVHGTADKHVPWEGGLGCGLAAVPFPSVPDSIGGWLARDGCTPAAPALVVEQGDGRCERQGDCAAASVILCTITGGGHSWPGGDPKRLDLPACAQAGEGGQSRTFLASEQIWAFFRQHALP